MIIEGVLFNSSARIEVQEVGEHSIYTPKGNCTEVGMIKYLIENDVKAFNFMKLKEDNVL